LDKTKSGKISARDYQLWGTKAATRNNVSFESDKVARWTDAFNSAQNNGKEVPFTYTYPSLETFVST